MHAVARYFEGICSKLVPSVPLTSSQKLYSILIKRSRDFCPPRRTTSKPAGIVGTLAGQLEMEKLKKAMTAVNQHVQHKLIRVYQVYMQHKGSS